MNVGRLMLRAQGYRLRPHAEALPYLATALYYFPDDREFDDLGTTLYRTDRAIDDADIVEEGRTVRRAYQSHLSIKSDHHHL